jgi:hypothetical protein
LEPLASGYGASLIPVPDNQDTFIAVLQRVSGINARSPLCAQRRLRFAQFIAGFCAGD